MLQNIYFFIQILTGKMKYGHDCGQKESNLQNKTGRNVLLDYSVESALHPLKDYNVVD